jgi:hypothetical protein
MLTPAVLTMVLLGNVVAIWTVPFAAMLASLADEEPGSARDVTSAPV